MRINREEAPIPVKEGIYGALALPRPLLQGQLGELLPRLLHLGLQQRKGVTGLLLLLEEHLAHEEDLVTECLRLLGVQVFALLGLAQVLGCDLLSLLDAFGEFHHLLLLCAVQIEEEGEGHGDRPVALLVELVDDCL